MKPNEPHHWTITLLGKFEPGKKRIEQIEVIEDIEGALQQADELESAVDFDVLQFVITRGAKASTETVK